MIIVLMAMNKRNQIMVIWTLPVFAIIILVSLCFIWYRRWSFLFFTFKVWEWIRNCIPHLMMDSITYSNRNLSSTMSVKSVPFVAFIPHIYKACNLYLNRRKRRVSIASCQCQQLCRTSTVMRSTPLCAFMNFFHTLEYNKLDLCRSFCRQNLKMLLYKVTPMAQCKTAVTPLLTHCSYSSLAVIHRYILMSKLRILIYFYRRGAVCSIVPYSTVPIYL